MIEWTFPVVTKAKPNWTWVKVLSEHGNKWQVVTEYRKTLEESGDSLVGCDMSQAYAFHVGSDGSLTRM